MGHSWFSHIHLNSTAAFPSETKYSPRHHRGLQTGTNAVFFILPVFRGRVHN